MEIGNLRLRAQIQTYTETQQAGTASTNKIWTTIKTVWCNVEPVKGLITFDTQQIGVGITHKVTIRYQAHIHSELWLLLGNKRFRIRNVQNLNQRNKYLVLLCEEVFTATQPFLVGSSSVGDSLVEGL